LISRNIDEIQRKISKLSAFRDQGAVTIDMQNSSSNPYRKALNTALRILTRRDHSKHELSQKLKARGHAGEIIDKVISECERFDYINDERTAEVFIRRLHRKGYGRKRIRFELNLKGFRGNHIQTILSKNISDADECQCAETIFKKYAGRFDREKNALKRKDKIYRFLYARGFSITMISDLIRKIG
jgi:regulatory protein